MNSRCLSTSTEITTAVTEEKKTFVMANRMRNCDPCSPISHPCYPRDAAYHAKPIKGKVGEVGIHNNTGTRLSIHEQCKMLGENIKGQ